MNSTQLEQFLFVSSTLDEHSEFGLFTILLQLLVYCSFLLFFGPGYISSAFNPDNSSALSASVKILLAFCLMPNFASLSAPMIHLWSIGVEEQFYAAWPWVFRQKLNLVLVCVGIIIIKFSLTPILNFLLRLNGFEYL